MPPIAQRSSASMKVITMPANTPKMELLPPQPSKLPLAGSKNFARILRQNMTYLQGCLPPDSQSLYTPRRYGNHLGVPCVCAICEQRPPHYIKPWNRWRWMNFHQLAAHRRSKI
jgi:hypothetical protein